MAKIFVGSLPTGITQDTFTQLFQTYGTFTTIVCNPEKRYGFVVYSTMEEAQAAMGAMNGFQMEGTALVVKLANNQGGPGEGGGKGGAAGGYGPMAGVAPAASGPGERLYIKGLPAGLADEQARELFSNYGTVVDAKVLVNNGKTDDGTGQSVAIIRFGSLAEAQWLVDNLNGNIPQGLARPVEVSFAGQGKGKGKGAEAQQTGFSPYGMGAPMAQQWNPMAQMGGGGKGGGAMEVCVPTAAALKAAAAPTSTCYVKGLPPTADDLYLYRVFAPFGRILSAKALNKGTFCIAFITFASDMEAQEAVMQVNGQMLTDGQSLQVSIKNQKGPGGAMAGMGALAGLPGFGM